MDRDAEHCQQPTPQTQGEGKTPAKVKKFSVEERRTLLASQKELKAEINSLENNLQLCKNKNMELKEEVDIMKQSLKISQREVYEHVLVQKRLKSEGEASQQKYQQ